MSGIEPAPVAGAPGPPGPPPDAAVTSGGRQRNWLRALIVAVVGLAAVLVVGYVGLVFLGSQVKEALRGTIEFGAAGTSGCSVNDRTSSFSTDETIYFAAHLAREVPAGEVVTVRVLQDGTEVETTDRTFEQGGDCLAGSVPAAGFPPGHYVLEYRAGTEPLASGEFDVGS